MQIDWITVAAQIVNFLILVYLLKRFLYRPVIDAMDRREARIRERLESADRREHNAEHQAARYAARREALEARERELLAEARSKADAEHERLLDEARNDVAAQRRRWQEDLERERADSMARLGREVAAAAVRIAERILADLADADLDEHAARSFLRRLTEADEKTLAHLREVSGPLHVATPHTLSNALRDRLRTALESVLGRSVEIRFSEAKDLVLGITLSAQGWRMAWTASDYLETVTSRLDEALTARAEARE